MNEDLVVRAFLRRFLTEFSGAASAINVDDVGFDPRESTGWYEFHIDNIVRKARHHGDPLRLRFNAYFTICIKSPEANAYDGDDKLDELREIFEGVCFSVTDESSAVVGKIKCYEMSITDASANLGEDLAGEPGGYYVCQLSACATQA
jgi:hypothetical protein